MSPQDRATLVGKLKQWVELIPEPDMPLVGFADGSSRVFTPRDIVAEIEKGTPLGQEFADSFAKMLSGRS